MNADTSGTGKGHTDLLIDLALDTKYSDIPPDVVHATKRIILDTVGCCVAAFGTDAGQILVDLKRRQGSREEATLLVYGDRLPVTSVSYVHSQLANALDLDETLLHRTHYANSIVMPALAVAELTGATGKEVMAAVALGYDIGARVGLSMPYYELTPDGTVRFVPVRGYSWAVFGTVAAAGRLLGLSHQQMANAFGISHAATPVHFSGLRPATPGKTEYAARPMHKYAMFAAIAEAGVNAALLAAAGFTGHTSILDRDRGFWTAFGVSPADWDFMIRDLRRQWFISETSLKFYPVGRQGSIPVDLFSKIVRAEGLSSADIETVTVRVPPAPSLIMALYDNSLPQSQLGPMTVPHALGLVAAGIESSLKWVSHETLDDPKIRGFAQTVKYEVKQEWHSVIVDQIKAEGTYRRIPTEVEIMARGKLFRASAEHAKGDPWSPEPMTDEELAVKFANYTESLIGRANVDRAVEAAFDLDAASDVRKLMGALHV